MTDAEIPKRDSIVRYVSPSKISGRKVGWKAFRLKENEHGLSVNWLKSFVGVDKRSQLKEIRRVPRLSLSPNGGYAEMNVEDVCKRLKNIAVDAKFVHSPLRETDDWPADLSHSEIIGLPCGAGDAARAAAEELAECVDFIHSATDD